MEKLFLQEFGNTLQRAGRHVQQDLSFSDGSEIKSAERDAFACTGRTCTRTDSAETTNLSNFLDLERSEYRILRYHYEEIDPWQQSDYLKYEKWSYVRKTPYDSSDSNDNSLTIKVTPTYHVYGVWGEHGFGRIQAGVGRFAGIRESDNLSFDGTSGFISPYVIGNAAAEAPGGTGSAMWRGPAEAVAVETFAYQRGTASLTITDLSDPELSVSIVINGQEIGSSNWSSIALTDSRFDVGTNEQDRLVGFFSPSHVESWGTFDTQTYLGIFGAKRKRMD